MICKKCNSKNKDDATFCSKCGAKLKTTEKIEETVKVETTDDDKVTITLDTTNAKNIFKYLVNVCTKPLTATKTVLKKVTTIENAGILSAIVIGIMVVVNLFVKMISCIFVKQFSFGNGYKTVIDFGQIAKLDFINLIFQNILIYALIILLIAVTYYIAGLVVKKEMKFTKLLIISTNSLVPVALITIIGVPIINIFSVQLAAILSILGILYSVIILVKNINTQIEFKDANKEVYFHVICLGIIIALAYFFSVNYISNTVNGVLTNFK